MSGLNRYVLGTKPRLKLIPKDINGIFFVPNESRISVKEPTGDIITYSGADLTIVTSGYLFVIYRPPVRGYYEYEGWVKDGNGLEDAATNGFEVYDRVYQD